MEAAEIPGLPVAERLFAAVDVRPASRNVVNRCAALQRRDPSLTLPLAKRRGGIAATDATSPGGSNAPATEPPRFSCRG